MASQTDVAFTPSSESDPQKLSQTRRKPIPRKGHTKSRRGCFNCKKRKIKCQEDRPECHHCVKAGLRCNYPTATIKISRDEEARETTQSESPRQLVHMPGTNMPSTFSLDDMRLFHHFLIAGYPHLPIGADKVWVTSVPTIAYEYDYLIHAILGLAASNMGAFSPSTDVAAGMQHRVIAMRSLNNAITTPARSQFESDARFAASLALTFQTAHLPDALSEFLTLLRGSTLIAIKDGLGVSSMFHAFAGEEMFEIMCNRIGTASISPVKAGMLDEAVESLDAIKPLCLQLHEELYWRTLYNIVRWAYDHPTKAYGALCLLYNYPARLSPEEFESFADPHNPASQLLLAHFLALQKAIWPILMYERKGMGQDRQSGPSLVFSWLDNIVDRADDEVKELMKWPLKVKDTDPIEFMAFNIFAETGFGGFKKITN